MVKFMRSASEAPGGSLESDVFCSGGIRADGSLLQGDLEADTLLGQGVLRQPYRRCYGQGPIGTTSSMIPQLPTIRANSGYGSYDRSRSETHSVYMFEGAGGRGACATRISLGMEGISLRTALARANLQRGNFRWSSRAYMRFPINFPTEAAK